MSETTATATWALEDVVINTEHEFTIRGAAFYHDRYVKVAGDWKIASTGYRRIYEETESRKETPSLKLSSNMWANK